MLVRAGHPFEKPHPHGVKINETMALQRSNPIVEGHSWDEHGYITPGHLYDPLAFARLPERVRDDLALLSRALEPLLQQVGDVPQA